MFSRGPYRWHSAQFKLQLRQDICCGAVGRRGAQRKYGLSANLTQLWLTQYDSGGLDGEEVEASVLASAKHHQRRGRSAAFSRSSACDPFK